MVTRHNARCYVRIVTSAWLPRARPARIAHQASSPRPRGLACGLACVIALLIPADTSECERVFSLMNDLKTSGRNCINQSNLKNTMIWHTIAKGLKCQQVPVQLILNEFRALGGIRGRKAHRGADPSKYDHRVVDP